MAASVSIIGYIEYVIDCYIVCDVLCNPVKCVVVCGPYHVLYCV
jgi:hypothetical protein